MSLTGRAGQAPLGPPAPLVDRLAIYGRALPIDPLAMLSERAAIAGLSRHGDISCGQSSRLIRAADGWIAITLARDEDREAVPAWLELDADGAESWSVVSTHARHRPVDLLVERAVLLGLPVSALPEQWLPVTYGVPPFDDLPVRATCTGPHVREPSSRRPPLVIDLTALWAGPLCGHVLSLDGARVIKVESTQRPDGARRGPREFFDLMNGGKESVALDFDEPSGRATLVHLLEVADVVIDASRPRALEQRGIVAEDLLRAARGPSVWISITGHGRAPRTADRVAFGDDAAVAGGLVVRDGLGPCFCADAIADPLSGVVAAVAARRALDSGRRWLIDVSMAGVAADVAGPTLDASALADRAAPPRARPATKRAAPLGRDTRAVVAELS